MKDNKSTPCFMLEQLLIVPIDLTRPPLPNESQSNPHSSLILGLGQLLREILCPSAAQGSSINRQQPLLCAGRCELPDQY